MTKTQNNNQRFYEDKLLPAVFNLKSGGVTKRSLRYVAHEILLHIGDGLPDTNQAQEKQNGNTYNDKP